MTIYEGFVYPDKLVSPLNGYETKVITKQTIKHFGFSSKEELLKQFPGFPLCCDDVITKRKLNFVSPNTRKSVHQRERYSKNIALCTYCGKSLPYEKRGNKFCNRSCAATHNNALMSPLSRIKQAKTLSITRMSNPTPERTKKISKKLIRAKKIPIKLTRVCKMCNIEFDTYRSKYCSDSCRSKRFSEIGKASAARRVIRSKDEVKLFELCSHEFKCLSNHIIANGWDADIVIPDHKLAILWNGPWHYKEMNISNHSLKQVQNRDRIKTQLFESLGWKVLIYEDRYHTPDSAFADIKVVAGAGFEPA